MTQKCLIGNTKSRATFFRHSAVLSVPAVLLRKSLIALMILPYPLTEYQCAEKLLSVNLLTDILRIIIKNAKLLTAAEHPSSKLSK